MLRVAKGSGRKCGDGTSVGLFIPLPVHLAKKFPSLLPDDHSPSHVTLLYIGEVTDEGEQERLVEKLREICAKWYWTDARATIGDISSFDHGERVVPHLQVEFSRDFGSFRRLIKQELVQAGFPCDDKYVEYKPHVTLDYLPPDEEWEGKTPKGSWIFDKIEVWGLPEVVPKIQLGRPKTAYETDLDVSARIHDLRMRLARLRRCSTNFPPRGIEYLPPGADFIWTTLGRLETFLRSEQPAGAGSVEAFLKRVAILKQEIAEQAKGAEQLLNRVHTRYHNETARSLTQLNDTFSDLMSSLETPEARKLRTMLTRTLHHVYPS